MGEGEQGKAVTGALVYLPSWHWHPYHSTQAVGPGETGWPSGQGVGLRPGRPGFESALSHEAFRVNGFGQLLTLTSAYLAGLL